MDNKVIMALVIILVIMGLAGLFVLNPTHVKTDTRVIVTSNSTLHDGDSFSIRLTDLNNTPIANQIVNITIIDANGDENHQVVTTDVNGCGSLQLNGLATTNYTVKVSFGGNDNFTSCNTTQKLQMKEKVSPNPPSASSTGSSSNSNSHKDDGYWETSPDADFEYHTEYYSDGNFRQYDRSGRLVGSSYDAEQYEVGTNIGFKI